SLIQFVLQPIGERLVEIFFRDLGGRQYGWSDGYASSRRSSGQEQTTAWLCDFGRKARGEIPHGAMNRVFRRFGVFHRDTLDQRAVPDATRVSPDDLLGEGLALFH